MGSHQTGTRVGELRAAVRAEEMHLVAMQTGTCLVSKVLGDCVGSHRNAQRLVNEESGLGRARCLLGMKTVR